MESTVKRKSTAKVNLKNVLQLPKHSKQYSWLCPTFSANLTQLYLCSEWVQWFNKGKEDRSVV